jgi:primosomal protein N' (replication factor Y) (superfamily II helicase)
VSETQADVQLELLRAATRGKKPKPPDPPAESLPVARVAVDLPLPHLDRAFDYAVPQSMSDDAQPGVRVRVRFAGQDVEGYLLERVAESDHQGRLTPLRRVVSAERVLSAEVLRLARAVADRYAGSLNDVLRLAVPPRHARAEQAPRPEPVALPVATADPTRGWEGYPAGAALVARLAAGGSPRAVWTALAGPSWTTALAGAIEATLASGRGALVVLPDRRDVEILDVVLNSALGPGRHTRLEADLGPTARYRNWLAVLRGDVQVAIGTRAAAFAPIHRLGLVAIWDDGDDLHQEPRAPYPHAREVLALRAELEGAALITGGWSRTVECAAWVRSGWARPVLAGRATLRAGWPAISVASTAFGADEDPSAFGRIPAPAWRAVRDGLQRGPVLVQVPRAGYLPGLSCQTCRKPARCTFCHGPLGFPAGAQEQTPQCRWCGRIAASWTCPHCQGHRLRATSVGVVRTAEELGRAFPGSVVVVPRAEQETPAVPAKALVVATPGLEPPAPDGYAAAVLLDAGRLLERADLRASEDALRRWLAAAALVLPAQQGGKVVICADSQAPAVQALVRVDPAWHADRELDERAELGFPPVVVMAELTGPAAAVGSLLELARLPDGTQTLGPIAVAARPGPADNDTPAVRVLLRAARRDLLALAAALHAAAALRSARREPGAVRIQVDPPNPG